MNAATLSGQYQAGTGENWNQHVVAASPKASFSVWNRDILRRSPKRTLRGDRRHHGRRCGDHEGIRGSPALDARLLATAQVVEHQEISRYGDFEGPEENSVSMMPLSDCRKRSPAA